METAGRTGRQQERREFASGTETRPLPLKLAEVIKTGGLILGPSSNPNRRELIDENSHCYGPIFFAINYGLRQPQHDAATKRLISGRSYLNQVDDRLTELLEACLASNELVAPHLYKDEFWSQLLTGVSWCNNSIEAARMSEKNQESLGEQDEIQRMVQNGEGQTPIEMRAYDLRYLVLKLYFARDWFAWKCPEVVADYHDYGFPMHHEGDDNDDEVLEHGRFLAALDRWRDHLEPKGYIKRDTGLSSLHTEKKISIKTNGSKNVAATPVKDKKRKSNAPRTPQHGVKKRTKTENNKSGLTSAQKFHKAKRDLFRFEQLLTREGNKHRMDDLASLFASGCALTTDNQAGVSRGQNGSVAAGLALDIDHKSTHDDRTKKRAGKVTTLMRRLRRYADDTSGKNKSHRGEENTALEQEGEPKFDKEGLKRLEDFAERVKRNIDTDKKARIAVRTAHQKETEYEQNARAINDSNRRDIHEMMEGVE